MRAAQLPLLVLLVVLSAMGCRGVRSTVVNRNSDNTFIGNSNGDPKIFDKTRPYTGIPIRVNVPTHLDVAIMETYYIQQKSDGKLEEVEFPDYQPRNLTVQPSIVNTPKVFMVDFVRPAAGTMDMDINFTSDQYFKDIKNKIVDETIQDITKAIESLSPVLTKAATKSTKAAVGAKLENLYVQGTRTVAYARFDIDDSDFEAQVAEFVQVQLNGCHACSGRKHLDGSLPVDNPALVPGGACGPMAEEQNGEAVPEQASRIQPRDSGRPHAKKESRAPILKNAEYSVYPVE